EPAPAQSPATQLKANRGVVVVVEHLKDRVTKVRAVNVSLKFHPGQALTVAHTLPRETRRPPLERGGARRRELVRLDSQRRLVVLDAVVVGVEREVPGLRHSERRAACAGRA